MHDATYGILPGISSGNHDDGVLRAYRRWKRLDIYLKWFIVRCHAGVICGIWFLGKKDLA